MSYDMELEIKELRAALQEKEEILTKAAQFGKQLLETNQELEQQLEDNTKAYYEKVELLEQEKHSLQLKYTCQSANLTSLQQELDSLQGQLEDKYQDELKRVEEVYMRKSHMEAATSADLKAELEKMEVQLRTLKEKSKHQEETIEQLREDLSCQSNSTMLQHELNDLEQLFLDERSRCEALQAQLLEAEGNTEVLAVEREGLLSKVSTLEEECQERCRLSNEWFESLKEVRDQNLALRSELDLLKMEQKRGFFGTKGNSLFGEVEDKRMEAERKFISLQVKYEGLEKNYTSTKQRYTRLKAEMSALFCRYSATSADSEHLQRLQRALSQSHSENESLRNKIYKLETQQTDSVSLQDKRKLMSAFVDFGDKAEYIQFLEHEIDQAKAQHVSVLKELDVKRTQLVWESNKLSEAESKLYHSEQQNARKKEENTKLRIRLQESVEKHNESSTKIAQLEADKVFLEGELKSQRSRRSLTHKPLPVREQPVCTISSNSSLNSCDTTSSPSDELVSSSDSVHTLKSSDSNVQSVCDRDSSGKSSSLEKPQRVINLLEELETEFNRQKSDVGPQRVGEKRNLENTQPFPSSNVVYVNSKKADQCSQQ